MLLRMLLQEVRSVLDYARKLAKYANDDDLLPGLGMPSVHGGSLDAETKRRDIRDLFKLYVEGSVAQEVSGRCLCRSSA